MIIIKYSHHFVVREISFEEKGWIRKFLVPLLQVNRTVTWNGNKQVKIAKVFAASDALRMEYRFHINQYVEFLAFIKQQKGSAIPDSAIHTESLYTPAAADLLMNPLFIPKEESQVPIINYLMQDDGVINKMIELQPGGGKTFISLFTAALRKSRVMLVTRPKYIGGWLEAIYGAKRVTAIHREDVIVIQGSESIARLVAIAEAEELTSKVILLSNKTLAGFIHDYEMHPETCLKKYGCFPVDLCRILGIGTLIRDEVHIDFHMYFKFDLYTHCPMSISLSGTYDSQDQFIQRMQQLLHPRETRAPEIPYNKYVEVIALKYGVKSNVVYNHRGRTDYSHSAFEASVIKDRAVRKRWLDLILTITEWEFVKERLPNERFMVMCSTVSMCDLVYERYQQLWPELDVRRFCQGDPYDPILTADLIVTTVNSGHASIDIPNLKVTLLTPNVGSKEINEQALCRTRDNPNFTPKYLYLFTTDIGAAGKYHQMKKEFFSGKALRFATRDMGVSI